MNQIHPQQKNTYMNDAEKSPPVVIQSDFIDVARVVELDGFGRPVSHGAALGRGLRRRSPAEKIALG